ncbi:hypothetical protein D3C71_1620590 [compost metagenome]
MSFNIGNQPFELDRQLIEQIEPKVLALCNERLPYSLIMYWQIPLSLGDQFGGLVAKQRGRRAIFFMGCYTLHQRGS